MKTELEKEDIQAIGESIAEILREELKSNYDVSLVDIDRLAEYLGVRSSWVYNRTRAKGKNTIPRVMVGKYLRFNIHEVLEWLKKQ